MSFQLKVSPINMVHVSGNRDDTIVEKTFPNWNTNLGQWNVHSSKLRIAMDNSHLQKEVHPGWWQLKWGFP